MVGALSAIGGALYSLGIPEDSILRYETALKIARVWGYRAKGVPSGAAQIITCANNFRKRGWSPATP